MLNNNEQLFLELVNRARLDPLGEVARQGIDLNEGLEPGTIGSAPVQALAPNAQIQQAAQDHNLWMLATDTFAHEGKNGSDPGDRMVSAGYSFEGRWSWGENLALFRTTGRLDAEAAITTHHDGLYASSGHRKGMFEARFRETGVSQELGEFESGWNASLLTQNFALSGDEVFLTGVVYNDTDRDGSYSTGEGQDGLQISVAGSTTATWSTGGYSVALDSDPSVSVTLGSGATSISLMADMSDQNVKLDLLNGERILTSGNVVLGDGARDVQMLGATDNTVTGNTQDNFFYVGRGDNTLIGGGGDDTAVFTGLSTDYNITMLADGKLQVVDLRAGAESDGTNQLTNFSFLQFSDITQAIESLSGDDGDSTLAGGEGEDTLPRTAGNDIIEGGPGIDTAVFSGNQASYTLTLSPTSTTIADRRTDGNGTDTLIDIELLDFDTDLLDGPFDLTQFGGTTGLSGQDFESFIELYIAYFDRAPDAVGLNFWGTAFAKGTSLEDMATLFIDQEETAAAYPGGTTNDAFAATVYDNVLGRTPDQDGFDFWVDQIDSGSVSRDQFILEVLRGVQPGSPDRSYLDDKVDIGAYFAVHKGMSDTDNAAAVMELFDDAGMDAAATAIEGHYAEALDPNNGEFLMQVVGVLDDQFA